MNLWNYDQTSSIPDSTIARIAPQNLCKGTDALNTVSQKDVISTDAALYSTIAEYSFFSGTRETLPRYSMLFAVKQISTILKE